MQAVDYGPGPAGRAGFARQFWRRLAQLALTVALTVLISSVLVRYAPGYGMDERRFEAGWSDSGAAAQPSNPVERAGLAAYCVHFFTHLCSGEWGDSVAYSRPVRELILARGGTTLRSVATGLGAAWLCTVALSFALGLLRRGWCHGAVTALAGLLLCVPAAVVGVLAMVADSGPALAIGVILWPRLMVQWRTITAETARQPHVLAARSRGVGGVRLLALHVWWPAAPQMLALAGVMVNHAIGVAIPVETICDSPGVGQMMWQAGMARDLPLLVHLTLLVALVTSVANLASDAGSQALKGAR